MAHPRSTERGLSLYDALTLCIAKAQQYFENYCCSISQPRLLLEAIHWSRSNWSGHYNAAGQLLILKMDMTSRSSLN